jgi:hypothetical protein
MTRPSDRIRARLKAAGQRFRANDNIAACIEPGELEALTEEVAERVDALLHSLVIDTENDHNTRETGARVARMYVAEIFAGRYTPSPDLTAFPPCCQGPSGEPITRDVTGEEFYSTLYAISESPLEKGVIWTGSNDGPFSVTRDDGKTWARVTPKDLPEGGRVAVRARRVGEAVNLYVEDSGVGIPKDALPKLARPFELVNLDASKPSDGSGLGLALAHKIAQEHGGELRAENRAAADRGPG